MISHVVLFRPRATLTAAEREALIAALQHAVSGIPTIRRATIGKRILLNRPGYETQMAEHYEYSAILEFDSEADLRLYLDHPAHVDLGQRLFTAAEIRQQGVTADCWDRVAAGIEVRRTRL